MTDPTEEFFYDLRRRAHDRRLEIGSGAIRFDIHHDGDTRHWLVCLNEGDIEVSEAETGGDAVVDVEREVFNRIASGEAYFLTVVLRGEAKVEGNPRLFASIRRLFPAPPATRARPSGGHT